jgi:hypothetical protein
MANWCEHGLREGKTELRTRWRHRWCDAVAGTTAPAMARGAGEELPLLLLLAVVRRGEGNGGGS